MYTFHTFFTNGWRVQFGKRIVTICYVLIENLASTYAPI